MMICRIDRLAVRDNRVLLRISGRITGREVDMLRTVLQEEDCAVMIDLRDVGLVDREAVKLLAFCESHGAELRNCSAYIREWVTREGLRVNMLEKAAEGEEGDSR